MNMHEVALPRYTEDFALWLEHQLHVLRERDFQQLDVQHLLKEMEACLGSHRRELEHPSVCS